MENYINLILNNLEGETPKQKFDFLSTLILDKNPNAYNIILYNALRSLSNEQKGSLCRALIERGAIDYLPQ